MSTSDDVQEILALASRLSPHNVAKEVDRLRQSVQGWRPRIGGHSSDHAMPGFDTLDRRVHGLEKKYRAHIEAALHALRVASATQEQLTFRLTPAEARKLAEEEVDGATCANPNCSAVIVPPARVLGGRCRACHEYRRDHDGAERPRELTEKAIL